MTKEYLKKIKKAKKKKKNVFLKFDGTLASWLGSKNALDLCYSFGDRGRLNNSSFPPPLKAIYEIWLQMAQ